MKYENYQLMCFIHICCCNSRLGEQILVLQPRCTPFQTFSQCFTHTYTSLDAYTHTHTHTHTHTYAYK